MDWALIAKGKHVSWRVICTREIAERYEISQHSGRHSLSHRKVSRRRPQEILGIRLHGRSFASFTAHVRGSKSP